jgi:hypothetical protein
LGRRAHRCSVCRSSSDSTNFAVGRPVLAIDEDYQIYTTN